jgi:uncharacterized membrane protein
MVFNNLAEIRTLEFLLKLIQEWAVITNMKVQEALRTSIKVGLIHSKFTHQLHSQKQLQTKKIFRKIWLEKRPKIVNYIMNHHKNK